MHRVYLSITASRITTISGSSGLILTSIIAVAAAATQRIMIKWIILKWVYLFSYRVIKVADIGHRELDIV